MLKTAKKQHLAQLESNKKTSFNPSPGHMKWVRMKRKH